MGIPNINYKENRRKMWYIKKFGGLNKSVVASEIAYNESPDTLNSIIDKDGNIQKRTGYAQIFNLQLDSAEWASAEWATDQWEGNANDEGVRLLGKYRKDDGTDQRLLIHEGGIFEWTDTTATKLYPSLTDNVDNYMIQVDNYMYFGDGTNYVRYDGTTFSTVESSAYIPTITLGRAPSGGGTANEQFNLLGAGFIDSFSGDGTSTTYQLSFTDLDATAVTLTIDGTAKTEGTHFTVNRTNGTVDFTGGSAPHGAPATGTNNVLITAYKTQTGFADRIKKCTKAILYGGSNDTRLLLTGNPDSPSVIWRSGLTVDGKADPTYFPENTFSTIGDKNQDIHNFVKQYDTLIIVKEESTYQMTYTIIDGVGTFPTKPLNDTIGAFAKNSLSLIDNAPIMLDKRGVYVLVQSNVRDERNMVHISENIDPDLLSESNYENAFAIDFDRKYHLFINDNVYIFDYDKSSFNNPIWFKWDNVPALCAFEYDTYLYFGDNAQGQVEKFAKPDDDNAYSDNGAAINFYWYSKEEFFKAQGYYKLIESLYVTLKPESLSGANIYYKTDKDSETLIRTLESFLFDYSAWHYDSFTYVTNSFPTDEKCRINKRRIQYFQIKIENNNIGESCSITNLGILHAVQENIK